MKHLMIKGIQILRKFSNPERHFNLSAGRVKKEVKAVLDPNEFTLYSKLSKRVRSYRKMSDHLDAIRSINISW